MSRSEKAALQRVRHLCAKRGIKCNVESFRGRWRALVIEPKAAWIAWASTRIELLDAVAERMLRDFPLKPGAPKGNANASRGNRRAKRQRTESELSAARGAP